MKAHDKTGDGCLSFPEFKSIFFNDQELAELGELDQSPFGQDGPTVQEGGAAQ